MKPIITAIQLKEEILKNPNIKIDPNILNDLPISAPRFKLYSLIIIILGIVLITLTIGTLYLASYEKKIPETFINIISLIIGSITGLLVPLPNKE